MNKLLIFFRESIGKVLGERELNYGVCKATDVLLDLEIDDEKIKQMLVKHFNILYSEAENVLKQAKEYRNK